MSPFCSHMPATKVACLAVRRVSARPTPMRASVDLNRANMRARFDPAIECVSRSHRSRRRELRLPLSVGREYGASCAVRGWGVGRASERWR